MQRYREADFRRETYEAAAAATTNTDRDAMEQAEAAAVQESADAGTQVDMAANGGSPLSKSRGKDAMEAGVDDEDELSEVDDSRAVLQSDADTLDALGGSENLPSEIPSAQEPSEVPFDIAEQLYKILHHRKMPTDDEGRITARRVMHETLKRIWTRLNKYISKADPPRKTGLVKATRAAIRQKGDDDEYKGYTIFDELRTVIGETVIEFFWYKVSFDKDSDTCFSRHFADDETKEELSMMDVGLKTVATEMTRQIDEIRGGSELDDEDGEAMQGGQGGKKKSSKGSKSAEGKNPTKKKKFDGPSVKWEPKEALMCWELFWDAEGEYANRHISQSDRPAALNPWIAANMGRQTERKWPGMEQHINKLIKVDKKTLQDMRNAVDEDEAEEIAETAKVIIASFGDPSSKDKKGRRSTLSGNSMMKSTTHESQSVTGDPMASLPRGTQSSNANASNVDNTVRPSTPSPSKRKRSAMPEGASDDDDGAVVGAEEESLPEPALKRSKVSKLGEHSTGVGEVIGEEA